MEMKVDTDIIEQSGIGILGLISDYKEIIDNIYARLNNMTDKTFEWVGISANNYVERFNSDYKLFSDVNDSVVKYGQFLIDYSNGIEEIIKEDNMSQIIYNKEQVNNNISSNIDNLLDKFEILKNEISQTSIPDDFPYYNYLLSINDLIDNYKNTFNNMNDNLKSLDIEITNNEDMMLQDLKNISDIEIKI